jgi:hypothetical protein
MRRIVPELLIAFTTVRCTNRELMLRRSVSGAVTCVREGRGVGPSSKA